MRTFSRHGCPPNPSKDPFINLGFVFSKVNVCACRPQSFLKCQTTPYILLPLIRIEMLILTCLKTKENKPHTPQQQQNPTLLSTALIHLGEKITDSLELGWWDNIREMREWMRAQVQIDRKPLGYFNLSLETLAGPDSWFWFPLRAASAQGINTFFCTELRCKNHQKSAFCPWLQPPSALLCWGEAEAGGMGVEGGFAMKKGKDGWSATVLRLKTF